MKIPRALDLLFVFFLLQTATSLKVSKKSYTFARNSLRSFDREDGRLLYSACKPGYTRHEKKCQVIGERTIQRPDTYACNVTLKTSKERETINPNVIVQRFGQDKAILFWQVDRDFNTTLPDELYSVITIVQLETCRVGEIRLDYKSAIDQVFFIPNGDTVEVFFIHSKICGNDMCKMIISEDGQLIDGPVAFFRDHDEPYLLKSLSQNSSEKGYFYVKRAGDETFYILINSDGSQKLLSRIPNHPNIYISTIHDWITACATYDGDKKYINCTQYDVNGNFEFETQLKKTTVDTIMKFVYNIREGGFFLVYFTSSNCPTIDTCARYVNNLLAKFDAGGKHVGYKAERNTNYVWDSMFENAAGHYCIFKNSYILDFYVKQDDRNRMRITHDCYNDNDFS